MSTFKDRYNNDDNFREKHLAYIQEYTMCDDCNRLILRCNMSRHKKTNIHKRNAAMNIDVLISQKQHINEKFEKKHDMIEKEKLLELNKIEKKINAIQSTHSGNNK